MKKKILFNSSAGYKNVLGDILPLYKICKEKYDCYIGIRDLEEEEVTIDGIQYLKVHSSKYRYVAYTAEYVIDSGMLSSKYKVYDKSKWINLWHGIPIKKMLLDEGEAPEKFINYFRYYDYFISPSSYYSKIVKDSFLYKGEIKEIGSPRYDEIFIEKEEGLYEELNIDKNKKVLLYAPTFREEGQIELPFDVQRIKEVFEDEIEILVKPHYLNKLTKTKGIIDVTNYKSINNIFKITDVLITDYSSLIFDYSLLKKDMILYQYDKEEYSATRGMYFDLEEYFPNNIVQNEEELYNKLKDIPKIKYDKFINDFLPHEKGDSSLAVYNEFIGEPKDYEMEEVIFVVNQLHEVGGVHNFIKTMAKNIKKAKDCKIILIATINKNFNNRKDYEFSSEYIDLILTPSINRDAIHKIFENTNGYIITTQMYAHTYFQKYFEDKNVISMFHADVEYAAHENELYEWEMQAIKDKKIRNIKSFVMLSEANANYLKNMMPYDGRVSYIENGIEEANMKTDMSGNVMFISRLEKGQKNIFELIKVGKEIKDIGSSVKIDIFGSGPDEEEFLKEIKDNGLENILIFKGYTNNSIEDFAKAKIHIMVSETEGLPYTILESLSVGVPTILYDTFLSAKDLIKDEENGYIINKGDYKTLVKRLDEYWNDTQKQRKMSEAALIKSKEYNYDNIIQKWLKEFEVIKKLKGFNQGELKVQKIKVVKTHTFKKDTLSGDYVIAPRRTQSKLINGYRKFKYFIRKNLARVYYNTTLINRVQKGSLINDFPNQEYLEYDKIKNLPQDKVSIVIPSYNSEKTVSQTIKSLLNQSYKNIEVLVIDDGSKDNTKDVVSKFKDARVKYFYKENEGLGFTRNYGIKKSTGEYIFFLDADDTIPKHSIKDLYYSAKYYDLEVISGKTLRIYLDEKKKYAFWQKHLYRRFNITNVNENRKIIHDTLSTNKLYKKEIFYKYNLWFEDVLYEDKLFTIQMYLLVDKIGLLNRHVYNWFVYGANTSITTTKDIDNLKERLYTLNKMFKLVNNDLVKEELTEFLVTHDFKIYLNEFIKYAEKDQEEIYNLINQTLSDKWDYIDIENIWRGYNYLYVKCIKEGNKEEFFKITKALSKDYFERKHN